MPTILKQRNFLASKIFEITDKSLRVISKTPFSYFENEFSFEELGTKTIHQKKPYLPGLIGCFLSLAVTIIVLFAYINNSKEDPFYEVLYCLSFFLFMAFITYLNHENLLTMFLYNGLPLIFFRSSPNKTEVDNFLMSLYAEQKKYLLNRYAKTDPYLTFEQIGLNLKWLWDRKIITDDELNNYRLKLLPKPKNIGSVGFNINPSSN